MISEGRRLILDIIDSIQIDWLLTTIGIEKAFEFANHFFLISLLKWYHFGDDFIKWIKTFLKNQESCILNSRKTNCYFMLERGTQQGDPISACCDYANCFKSTHIFPKIVSLLCSWVRWFFDNFHQWKVVPLYLIQKYLYM